MTDFESLLSGHDGSGRRESGERLQRAQTLFDERRYTQAATELESLLESERAQAPGEDAAPGLGHVELLLARAYFHSAQLGRAETTARDLVEREPDNGYAHRLLARTLERAGKRDDATPHARMADALGID